MSFQSLRVEELKEVAEFFAKDVIAADKDKGPSKKELLAALASDADGTDAVSWDDYKDIYLVAKESNQVKAEEVVEAEEEAAKAESSEPVDTSDYVLLKYSRKNPTYEILGYTFTTRHPFASVPPDVAEYLVRYQEGFRLALPSEVTDYYN